jgi:hypothetical protein
MPRWGRGFPSKPLKGRSNLPGPVNLHLPVAMVTVNAYLPQPFGIVVTLPVAQVSIAAYLPTPLVITQPQLVQQVSGSDISGYGLGTTLINTTAGNGIVVFAAWDTINTSISLTQPPSPAPRTPSVNVTDSAGNLWQQLGITVSQGYSARTAIWACVNAEQADWVSVALTGYAASLVWLIAEISGLPQTLSADFSAGDSTTPLQTSTVTLDATATMTDVSFGCLATPLSGSGDPALTTGPTGFTALDAVSAGASSGSGIALYPYWQPTTTAGAVAATWVTSSNSILAALVAGVPIPVNPPVQPSQSLPLVIIEAAFGASPGDITQSVDYLVDNELVFWTDISARAIGGPLQERISTSRGRQYELSQEEAGQLSVWLNNVDGALTPSNPGSPYYSNAINSNMSFQQGISPWAAQNNAALAQSNTVTHASAPGAVAQYSLQVTPDGVTANPGAISNKANIATAAGRVSSQQAASQSFSSSGSWTAPAGITSVGIECYGGGGGGGGTDTNAGSAGGGGGGGSYSQSTVSVTPGNSYSFTIGAGGAGGTGSGSQQFVVTFSGSTVWQCPAGVTSVKAECWGVGGNGGGTDNENGGGGGGGGEYAAEPSLAVTAGHTYAATVGGNGAVTTFAGDSVTVTAHAGSNASTSTGGAGGTGSTNTTHHDGGAGGNGSAKTSSNTHNGSSGSGGTSTQTYTPATGVRSVSVGVGAGGGGGGGGGLTGGYGGGGGGGGGYSSGILNVTAGNSYTLTIGNGGQAGPSGVGGGSGGSSSFPGDNGTVSATGGVKGNANGTPGGGGSPGGGSGGYGSGGVPSGPQGAGGGGGGGGPANGTGGEGFTGHSPGAGAGNGGSGGNGSTSPGAGNNSAGVSGGNGGGSAGGGGGGGGGANTNTSGDAAGNGGAGGITYTDYVPYGGGGAGSGAASGAGNSGTAATSGGAGNGAAALTGGGGGGNGGASDPGTPGQNGTAPGGGGGGGYATTGGNGGSGQVTLTYTVSGSVSNGVAGGTTSFGTGPLVSAPGGAGGLDGTSGMDGHGGMGGSGGTGSVLYSGGSGATGTGAGNGGGGGGSAGTSSAGNGGSGSTGGVAVTGGSAGGNGANVPSSGPPTEAVSPSGEGGGGGGGSADANFTYGASGAPGLVRITYAPSAAFSASAWFYSTAGYGAGAQVGIAWYNSLGSLISTSVSPAVSLPASQWTQVTYLNVSQPPAAVTAAVFVQLAGTPSVSLYYVAEAALVFGSLEVNTGLVQLGTPVRLTAWWNGRRYPVWFGYVERWPQDWPELPQWGFSQMIAVDAIAVASGNQMRSAVQGDILADNPYVYLPANESYSVAASPTSASVKLTTSHDASGLNVINYATGNLLPGIYANGAGSTATVMTGQSLNLYGDQGTVMGATSFGTTATVGVRGPSLFYTDPALPVNASGSSGFTVESWFSYAGTAQTCTLMTLFGPPSTFAVRAANANGALCSVAANGTANTLTVKTVSTSLSVAFTPSADPQHMALVATANNGVANFYLNGSFSGQLTLPVASQITGVTLGPGRYSYDSFGAASYNAFNFSAGHLAVYGYQLTSQRIAAHYVTGFLGASGITAAERFAQVLTWAQLGLKRGVYWWQNATGTTPEITQIGPAYSLSGSTAADATKKLNDEEGGRGNVQANGSYVYQERWAAYNLPISAVLGDNAAGAFSVLNANSAFTGGIAPWTATNGAITVVSSPAYIDTSTGRLIPSGSGPASIMSNQAPVTAGVSYTVQGWLQVNTGWSNVQLGVSWYDVNASFLSASMQSFTVPAGAWMFLATTQTAPAGAAFGAVTAALAGSPNTLNILYVTILMMYQAAPEIPYEKSSGYDYDNTYVYNETTATQQSGPNSLIIADQRTSGSQRQYFKRSALTYTSEVVSPYDVSDLVTWSLAKFSQPVMHVRQVVIDAAGKGQAVFPTILSLDIGNVVTVIRRPIGGAIITETGIIEKVQHAIGPGHWITTYQLSPWQVQENVLTVDGNTYANSSANTLGW